MTRAEIIRSLTETLEFPGNQKRLALAIDVAVLRSILRELTASSLPHDRDP